MTPALYENPFISVKTKIIPFIENIYGNFENLGRTSFAFPYIKTTGQLSHTQLPGVLHTM